MRVYVDLFQRDIMEALVAGAERGCVFSEREFLYDRLVAIGIRPRSHEIVVLHSALRTAQATDTVTQRFMKNRVVT